MSDNSFRDVIGKIRKFSERWLSPDLPVDEKLKEFSEVVGAPLDESEDFRTDLIDREWAKEQYDWIGRVGKYWFRPELHGAENLPPEGQGAVLVSNHAILALDSVFLFEQVYHATGRMIRPTVDRAIIRVPYYRQFLQKIGAIYGTRENAVPLLKEGELVLSYPGGAKEALKPTRDRYALYWDKTYGFIRCAIAAGVPVIPVASIGGDDAFISLLEDNVYAQKLMGSDRYKMPLYLGLGPLPLPVKLRFVIGEPVEIRLPPWKADDEDALAEVQQGIREKLEHLIQEELVRRGRGI